MNYFSIKDLENLTGIKAHTLRVWEQRYGIVVPQRKASNHRYYNNEDLKGVLRIAYLYHHGHKISKIAALSEEEIKQLAIQNDKQHPTEVLVNRLIEASIDFNEDMFETALSMAFQQFGFEKTIVQIIYPYLEKMGLFWMTDNIIPAQEHFSSNIIRHKIIAASDKIMKPTATSNMTVVLFSPTGEYHEIPLLIANYLFKKAGHKTVYFGCNVPLSTVESYVEQHQVTHIYTHLITLFTDKDINHFLQSLSKSFQELSIVISGPAAQQTTAPPKNVTVLSSFEQTIAFSKSGH